ncbi:hypothetical protein B4917_08055, partial [Helicobacter pylori]
VIGEFEGDEALERPAGQPVHHAAKPGPKCAPGGAVGLTGPGLKFFDSVSPHKSIGSKQSGKSSVPVGVSRLKSGSPASPTWRMALSRA